MGVYLKDQEIAREIGMTAFAQTAWETGHSR